MIDERSSEPAERERRINELVLDIAAQLGLDSPTLTSVMKASVRSVSPHERPNHQQSRHRARRRVHQTRR